jgi:hypothetical protein
MLKKSCKVINPLEMSDVRIATVQIDS